MPSPTVLNNARVESALRGETIYGDDFTAEEIEQWFADEVHGYSSLDHLDSQTGHYAYRALDAAYAWRHLPARVERALGLGSAFGSEFEPLAGRVGGLTIIEPEQRYWSPQVAGIPTHYQSPEPSGRLAFEDGCFDLVTAFGVLHHIPNVSTVFAELLRVLAPGALLIVREPIVSMGDWRAPRRGLTARERGLPFAAISRLCAVHGVKLRAAHMLGFGPLLKMAARVSPSAHWNSRAFVKFDALMSRAFRANYRYHRTKLWQRFAPTVGCWVIER
jgi:SAM-dependent methyltransferase